MRYTLDLFSAVPSTVNIASTHMLRESMGIDPLVFGWGFPPHLGQRLARMVGGIVVEASVRDSIEFSKRLEGPVDISVLKNQGKALGYLLNPPLGREQKDHPVVRLLHYLNMTGTQL